MRNYNNVAAFLLSTLALSVATACVVEEEPIDGLQAPGVEDPSVLPALDPIVAIERILDEGYAGTLQVTDLPQDDPSLYTLPNVRALYPLASLGTLEIGVRLEDTLRDPRVVVEVESWVDAPPAAEIRFLGEFFGYDEARTRLIPVAREHVVDYLLGDLGHPICGVTRVVAIGEVRTDGRWQPATLKLGIRPVWAHADLARMSETTNDGACPDVFSKYEGGDAANWECKQVDCSWQEEVGSFGVNLCLKIADKFNLDGVLGFKIVFQFIQHTGKCTPVDATWPLPNYCTCTSLRQEMHWFASCEVTDVACAAPVDDPECGI
jgi:hypothetical protein